MKAKIRRFIDRPKLSRAEVIHRKLSRTTKKWVTRLFAGMDYEARLRHTAPARAAALLLTSKQEERKQWLLAELADGPKRAGDLLKKAALVGISREGLSQARIRNGIVSKKIGWNGYYIWFIPRSKD